MKLHIIINILWQNVIPKSCTVTQNLWGFGLALRDCFASATVSLSVREKVCSASDQFLHNPKNTFSFSLGISLSLSISTFFFNFLRYYNIEFVCTYVYITIDICCFYFLGLVIVGIWSLKMEWNWVPLTKDYSLWRCYQSSIAWFRGGY